LVQIHTTADFTYTLIQRHRSHVAETSCIGKITISRVNAEAMEWSCWRRIIRHLSYFSTSKFEAEAVRLNRRGAEFFRHEVEKYRCCSLSEINDYIAIHHFFFFALHSKPLCENLLEPRQNNAEKYSDQSSNFSNNLTGFTKRGISIKL
jgi:hypothetical protein